MLLTGADAGSMQLELFNKDNKLICQLDNDGKMLGSYPVDDGMRIHVRYAEFKKCIGIQLYLDLHVAYGIWMI